MKRGSWLKLGVLMSVLLALVGESLRPGPSFSNLKGEQQSSDIQVLARDGTVIDEVRADFARRRLAWTPLSEVSPAFVRALLATEDQRFVGHPGVDVWALAHAATNLGANSRVRGASTITMQVVGLMQPGPGGQRRRTISAKILQMRNALALERRWSKAEILEAYVNLVGFRGELVGIRAAARMLFDKGPGGLSLDESLLLAAMIAQPNAVPKVVVRRACAAAKRLGESERCAGLPTLMSLASSNPRGQGFVAHGAPHAARRWLGERGAEEGVLQTTLDAEIQRAVTEEVGAQLRELLGKNVRDAAVLILDNASGEVLAYVGSSVSTSIEPDVDGVRAKRQAGSILKPFLYEQAFAERRLTAETLLDDSPLEVEVGGGIYQPKNYDKVFRGAVTAREALASSLNVPAVKVLDLVGVDAFWGRLNDLGFGIDEEAGHFGPSLALGTVDVSLEALTRAYRDLALRSEHDTAAGVVASILSDRVARSATFGLENHLSTRFYTSVKTGTSKDMRDNWCVGFSSRYTVGVWVGNFDGEPMWNVSGVTGAAPIWMKLMRQLHREAPSVAPKNLLPQQGVAEVIDDARVLARLTYPTNGMVLAWDPDLAPERQAILPEVWPRSVDATLELDGKPWPRGRAIPVEGLSRGAHSLILRGADHMVVDRVRFLVGTRLVHAATDP